MSKLFLFSKNKKGAQKASSAKQKNQEFSLTDEYKNAICSQSYLGKKGYTIPKSILNPEDLTFLKKDLFVKPELFGAFNGGATFAQESAFPVYRENAQKIYIPRFYGITRYGEPSLPCEIERGEVINVEFTKLVRDYQENIINTYINYVRPAATAAAAASSEGGGAILEVPCGQGKCLGKDTPILMYDGTIKMVQDVKIGDVLMGDDCSPRNVLSTTTGREQLYKVHELSHRNNNNNETTTETTSYIVNESHILSLKEEPQGKIIDINVLDYLELLKQGREHLGFRVPITFVERPIELDPFELGYWIGCNAVSSTLCSSIHNDYINKYNLLENIHIPIDYKCNARKIQMNVLNGLMSSPLYDSNYIETHVKHLADDILFLLRSLGYATYLQIKIFDGIEYYWIRWETVPSLTYRIKIENMGDGEYYGFEIDGNHRFVLGDFTVTHNTVMALKIISILQKKTLILVHKEFLMNQWIERIQEFIPNASVGKIQGQVIDIKGRDIVIGMIQSIYDKDYPADTFSCFGLTIIDEVHRIGSEQFSKTLLKTITPYMLGISATVDRKDKLTRILYMFIGEKIYSNKTRDDDMVYVRAVEYKSRDPVFNEVEHDFRGNPMYSKMIVKLCEYGPRSDFIIRIIADLLKENPNNQIMILAHNRSLLNYLYDAIHHKNIASAGYYVGGMKPASLLETEGKQIVIATYAMAAEALDIKTLSTLVMVTPKTDIIQSVGRILRMKHAQPIIVDIVDGHDLFKNQWKQRMRYYKKCNYRIQMTDSNQYGGMDKDEINGWKMVFNPKQNTSCVPDPEDHDDEPDNNKNKISIGKCLISLE